MRRGSFNMRAAEMAAASRSTAAAARLRRFLAGKKAYFVTTGTYFFERIYLLMIGVVLYAMLARAYGPETMGVFSFAQTIVSFAAPFLAAGCEAIVIRELVRKPAGRPAVMGAAFALITGSTIVVMIVPLGFVHLSHAGNPLVFTIAVLLSLSFLPNGLLVIEHYFKAEMRAASVVVPRVLVLTVSIAIKIALAWSGRPIVDVAVVTACESLVLGIALIVVYVRQGQSPLRWRLDRSESWFLFQQALPAMVSAVAVLLFFRVNHVLLAHYSTYAELGRYSAAFQIFQLTGMLPAVLFSTIYPRLVSLHGSDRAYFERIVNWLYFGFAAASYAICLVTYLSSDLAIRLLLGPKFAGAGTVLSVLVFSSVFTFLGSVRAQEINIYNRPSYHLISAAVGLVVLVPVSLYLIPRYGALGAAWGVTFGCFVSAVLTSFLFPRMRASGLAQMRALLLLPPLLFTRFRQNGPS